VGHFTPFKVFSLLDRSLLKFTRADFKSGITYLAEHGKDNSDDLFHIVKVIKIAVNDSLGVSQTQELLIGAGGDDTIKRFYRLLRSIIKDLCNNQFGEALRDSRAYVFFFCFHYRNDGGAYL